MRMYYDDDEDDDPYAPRIGPAAMPSPRSKFAPYYSGHANTFEDFLEEFEGQAYDCALTDPQRVDVIIRYVTPSLRDFWRSLNGYHSRDWPQLRQSLVNVFGSTTPRPQVMRQKLLKYVQVTSRSRMFCEDDVLRYYRQFLCYSAPLVHAGHLLKEERNTAFWCGFHPEDRKVLRPRLLGKNPLQPLDIPFHFEDVFGCARAAFAYDNYSFSPWSHAEQFKPPIVRCEQPVVEPIPRDAYSFRAVTSAVSSNAETTGNLDELPSPPQSTPQPQFPSSSPSVSDSQHTQAPLVTVDQPEATYTLSNTLPPSDHPLSHTPALIHLTSDSDSIPAPTFSIPSSTFLPSASEDQLEPEPAPTFPIITSMLRPSVSPTPSHSHSLAPLAADEPPEILSTFPSPSITPASFSMPMSDFEYLPSATVDQPEHTPTLSSTPPSSSISSTFVPFPVRSAMNNQPESEHEAASTVPLLSLPLSTLHPLSPTSSTPHPLSPLSSTSLPSPVTSATDDQPEPESMSVSVISTKLELSPRALPFPPDQKLDLPPRTLSLPPDQTLAPISSSTLSSSPLPEISTLDSTLVAPSPEQPSSLSGSLSHLSRPRELESSSPALAPSDVVTLSHPEASLSSLGETIPLPLAQHEASVTVPTPRHSTPPQRPPGLETFDSDSSPLEIPLAPANLAPSHSTFALLPVLPASSDFPSASASPSLVLGDLELESFPTPSPAVDIIPLSQPESSWSPVYEPVLLLPAPLEPIQCRSTLPQRPPGLKSVDSDYSSLEVAPALALSTPQLGWKPSHVYEVQSIKPPVLVPRPSLFHSSGSLRRTPARFGFALALVTMAVLISTFLNISATISIFARKFWSKYEDFGNNRNGTLKTSKSRNIPAQRLRLGQFAPHASCFVFDPGGQPSSPSFQVSVHEDAHKCKSKTRNGLHHMHDTSLPTPVPTDHLIVFDPGVVGFVLGSAHEDSATLDEDAWRLHLHARRTLPFVFPTTVLAHVFFIFDAET